MSKKTTIIYTCDRCGRTESGIAVMENANFRNWRVIERSTLHERSGDLMEICETCATSFEDWKYRSFEDWKYRND